MQRNSNMSNESFGSAHSKSTEHKMAASDASHANLDEAYMQQSRLNMFDKKDRPHVPQDWRDLSAHPSYSNFGVPYHLVCRLRWLQSRETMEQQFQKELQQLLEVQPNAAEALLFSRIMSYTSLWPPLHNHREINITQNRYFRMNRKQRARLHHIMKY